MNVQRWSPDGSTMIAVPNGRFVLGTDYDAMLDAQRGLTAKAEADAADARKRAAEAERRLAQLAGTPASRFHLLLDGIKALGWVHPAPHDSTRPPEHYALEWLAQNQARLALAVAEVKAWRSGQLRLRLLLVPTGVGEAFYAAFGDTNIWDATNADPVLAKMIGGGE